jgi:hypothetical protein
MTCVNAMPVYGMQCNRQNRLESETGEHVFSVFPGALCKWIGPHVVEMEALLH